MNVCRDMDDTVVADLDEEVGHSSLKESGVQSQKTFLS